MSVLTQAQKDAFWRDGYLVVENAVSPELLTRLQNQFSDWVQESREHDKPYGQTIDNKPRFDLQPGHSASKPALRRVNAPIEVSDAYLEAMGDSQMTQAVSELIGPNVKFHHSKINSKLPGSTTAVKWHQDFPFTPHTNDDVVTALLMVDEVTDTNGPLQVRAGSHTGPIYGLWHDGKFTGSINDDTAQDCEKHSDMCVGPAGSVCLMHTRLLHGSTANLSDSPRTLFIAVYSADDAIPLSPSPMPNKFEGKLISGQRENRVRSVPFEIELPELPSTGSFFDQQAEHKK